MLKNRQGVSIMRQITVPLLVAVLILGGCVSLGSRDEGEILVDRFIHTTIYEDYRLLSKYLASVVVLEDQEGVSTEHVWENDDFASAWLTGSVGGGYIRAFNNDNATVQYTIKKITDNTYEVQASRSIKKRVRWDFSIFHITLNKDNKIVHIKQVYHEGGTEMAMG